MIIYFLMLSYFLSIMNHFSYSIVRFLVKFIPIASTFDFNSICYFIVNLIKIFLANVILIFSFVTAYLSLGCFSKFNFFSGTDLVLFFERLIANLWISYFKNSQFIWWLKSKSNDLIIFSICFFFIFSTWSSSWKGSI